MSSEHVGPARFLRLFSVAIFSQAVVSAGSLLVGLILIRHQSDVEYGYYVLVTATLLLLTGLQAAFIQPPMIVRLARYDELARRDLVGGLFREQRRFLHGAAAGMALVAACLWLVNVITGSEAMLAVAAAFAAVAGLNREFFRMVLMAYRRPADVLRADLVFAGCLVAGAYLASFSPYPAITAVVTLGLSGLAGGGVLSRSLWRVEPWIIDGAKGIFKEIAPIGAWSVSGGAIHWVFSQGYTWLVAAMLDVHAVAAMAATRLPLMPVNLMSLGMIQIMLPTASKWLSEYGAAQLHRRLLLFCVGVSGVAMAYFGVMWISRGWIFEYVLKKDYAERDTLLIFWCLIHLFMLLRDQLAPLLIAMERLPMMTKLTAGSAVLALTSSYFGILRFGMVGALVGVLIGEATNVLGIWIVSRVASKQAVPA